MIIDTSAIVAIVRGEPDIDLCMNIKRLASARRISAGNQLEAYMVIDGGRNPVLSRELDENVVDLRLIVEPVTEIQIQIAREAFRRYGKGSGHPAHLNYGDCFAYALARYLNEPLLFVGNDFTHTDIVPAQ